MNQLITIRISYANYEKLQRFRETIFECPLLKQQDNPTISNNSVVEGGISPCLGISLKDRHSNNKKTKKKAF